MPCRIFKHSERIIIVYIDGSVWSTKSCHEEYIFSELEETKIISPHTLLVFACCIVVFYFLHEGINGVILTLIQEALANYAGYSDLIRTFN